MLTLYDHPLSPYARKVKVAIREKGVPLTVVIPDAIGASEAQGAFLKASPRGEVPALVLEDGSALFQSSIIMEYVEERWPEPALMPADPAARARIRMIEEIVDTQMEAINWGLMEVHVFGRAEPGLAETLTRRAGEQLAGLHDWLLRELGTALWFNGDACGRADLAVHAHCLNSATFGIHPPAGSPLEAWFARMNERPEIIRATTEAMDAAAAVTANLPDLVRSGAFKRQYRDHRLEWMIRSGGLDIVKEGLAGNTIRFSTEIC